MDELCKNCKYWRKEKDTSHATFMSRINPYFYREPDGNDGHCFFDIKVVSKRADSFCHNFKEKKK